MRERQQKYSKTLKGKLTAKRYWQSPKGKASSLRNTKQWQAKNPKKVRVYKKKYRHSKKGKAKQKAYQETTQYKQSRPDTILKNRYGITVAGKQAMYDKQKGLCKLCNKPLPTMNKSHVEHCHKTGKLRGLVHPRCNNLIGAFETAMEDNLFTPIINYIMTAEEAKTYGIIDEVFDKRPEVQKK